MQTYLYTDVSSTTYNDLLKQKLLLQAVFHLKTTAKMKQNKTQHLSKGELRTKFKSHELQKTVHHSNLQDFVTA